MALGWILLSCCAVDKGLFRFVASWSHPACTGFKVLAIGGIFVWRAGVVELFLVTAHLGRYWNKKNFNFWKLSIWQQLVDLLKCEIHKISLIPFIAQWLSLVMLKKSEKLRTNPSQNKFGPKQCHVTVMVSN